MTFCDIDLDEVGAEYINETKKDWFKIREDCQTGIPYLSDYYWNDIVDKYTGREIHEADFRRLED